MSDDVLVRVTGRQFRHDGEEYQTGDILEVPERAIEGWEARLERVDENAVDENAVDDGGAEADEAETDSGSDDKEDVLGEELDPHPGDLTVAELEARIADVDDVDLLHAIRDAEEDSDNRSGAKDAIEARLSELEPEG